VIKIPSIKKSNNAHRRLANFHNNQYKKKNDSTNLIKNGYHNNVLTEQERLNRKLSDDEKKKIYKRCEYYVYN
jgi:hypothetical protein